MAMNLNWTREKETKPYQGEQREGFTLTYVDHLHSLLLFGGTHSKQCDVYLFDLTSKSWKVQKISMPKPVPRKYHTAYYEKNLQALVVYGGEADKGRSLEGFDVLFMKDWRWKRLLIKTPPPARQFHSFTAVGGGNFLIFGGITLPYGTFLNDTWVLKNFKNLKETQTIEIAGCSCSQIQTKGQAPSGRYGHQAFATKDNYYILGGESEQSEQTFTVFQLNMSKLHWKRHTFNINLQQLVGFSILNSTSSVSQELLIFGGIMSKSKKNNRYLYSIGLSSTPTCKKLNKMPDNTTDILSSCCQLPHEQTCGLCCSFSAERELVLYRCDISFPSDQLSIEQYLRFIKNEQFVSQELIQKVNTLELLHRQIQGYISNLYRNYQDSDTYDPAIEAQKKEQIQACLALKAEYQQLDLIYEENLISMKGARRELAQLNQYFEECIETERDEELTN